MQQNRNCHAQMNNCRGDRQEFLRVAHKRGQQKARFCDQGYVSRVRHRPIRASAIVTATRMTAVCNSKEREFNRIESYVCSREAEKETDY